MTLMNDDDQWAAAAHHEAGHAAVALLLGAPVTKVSLQWGKRFPFGMVSVDPAFTDPAVLARVAAAGPVADAVWGALHFDVRFIDAYRLTDKQNPNDARALRGYLRQARLKRRRVVHEVIDVVHANWLLVTRIADSLNASGLLSGREIGQLI